MVLKGFRGAEKLQNTLRVDLDTAGAGLTFPNNEITQYSCFWECQCTGNDPQNLAFCAGPPQNNFIVFLRYLTTGALPPHPRTVDLKVSEMSAFGPPRGCASGSLWVNINKKRWSFWKHPSKTNIPDIRSTNPDKSLIGKMKPGWEALEF